VSTERRELVLHSSIRGSISGLAAPFLLLLAAAAGWWRQPRVGTGMAIALGLAVVLLLAFLLDHPHRTMFDPTGVTRVCWLRHHHIGWTKINRLSRGRGSSLANPRRKEGPSARATGPLVAVVGRRRYLLIDQCESRAEYEALRKSLDEWGVKASLTATPPPMDAPPTDLYRRRRKG
jgi:hypothetical protein